MNGWDLEEKEHYAATQPSRGAPSQWRIRLVRLIVVLWVLQLGWLAWQLREEAQDLPGRIWHRSWGFSVCQKDPFSCWLLDLARVIPPHDTHLFLDNYEAGKENASRYHLFPRRHLLLLPQTPPNLLYHTLREEGVSYVLVRDGKLPLGPGLTGALGADWLVALGEHASEMIRGAVHKGFPRRRAIRVKDYKEMGSIILEIM